MRYFGINKRSFARRLWLRVRTEGCGSESRAPARTNGCGSESGAPARTVGCGSQTRAPSGALTWRLWQEVRPCWPCFAGLLALSLLAPPIALLTPLSLKIVVDSVIGTHPLPHFLDAVLPATIPRTPDALLTVALVLVAAVALLGQLREFAASWLSAYTGERLLRTFRARLFRHVQRLSLSYHDTRGAADSTYRIQYDATAVQRIAVEGIVPFLTSAVTFLAMIGVMARINWQLALVGLAISPAVFLVSRVYRHRLRQQARELKKLESAALAVVQEVLGALRVVKAFGQEDREGARFLARSNEGMRARLGLVSGEGMFGLLVALFTAAGMAAVLYIGVRDIKAGTLTLGSLLLVLGYLAQIYSPLKTISKKVAGMQSHLASAERAFALLDEVPDVAEQPHARPLKRARGELAFLSVRFAYAPNRAVLQHITFAVEPGMCLGIVGATGAGKTTLVNLLTRFYDPTAGVIYLDGVDLRKYRLSDLRRQFAMVLQEPLLFSTSLAENIAYGRPQASEEEIIAAAKAANAHDFITALPDGYETLVGERGMKLSGGERQRISIARAFLKDAPILILDEPTSAVDARTEAGIVEAMGRLMQGRTTFIITHRASALKPCDSILRIEHGKVVEFRRAGGSSEAFGKNINHGWTNGKHQAPSTKLQRSSKDEAPSSREAPSTNHEDAVHL